VASPTGSLFSISETADDFAADSNSDWILTFWFRSQVPGQPDQAFSDPVGMWTTLQDGVVSVPVVPGIPYTVWATLDRGDGNGPTLIATETDGGTWASVTQTAPDTTCLAAADDSGQQNVAAGCHI
jgi:hypothetical protein